VTSNTKPSRGRGTQQALVDAAIKLMEDRGYHETSVEDIVSALDVTKPTFYYYYDSKLELLAEILQVSITRVEQALHSAEATDTSPQKRLAALIRAFALEVMDRPDLLTVYFNERNRLPPKAVANLTRREREVVSIFEEAIRHAQADINPSINPSVAAMAVVGMVSWAHRWYQPEGPLSPEVIADTFAEIACRGVFSRKEE
jgi:AcrR family transcriptional regulator